MYEVLIERTAERDLKSLPTNIFNRIVSRIKTLSENPRPSGCHKLAGSRNDWRIRIGDYRVVYEIDDPHKRVKIFRIRHRREVYR
ncbi:MAG TPA: type II toxin-antitoxin system RelE/ParE family toxin [Candidatus Binatia bacterium]